MTATDPFSTVSLPMSVADTVNMLKDPQLAIGWALENLPHQLNEFFTEWKAHEDPYLWATNMTAWVEYSRSE